jgi:circadian clock protein KaiC
VAEALTAPEDAEPGAGVGLDGERVSSGHPRLDRILGGGLPALGLTIIGGPPGSGKTILAQQYAFHNASADRPALYLSTVSEPLEKILRFGQNLAFFDAELVGKVVHYQDLGSTVEEHGLPGVLDRVVELIKRLRPGLIVIDSFKALSTFAEQPAAYRRFLHELAGWLSAYSASCFWVGEYDEPDLSRIPEFAIADSILQLGTIHTATRRRRALTVLKLRGSAYQSGLHSYRITPHGLEVYPRLADLGDPSPYQAEDRRQSSGVEALDAMLGDGYRVGSSTLCAGPSGAGKTLMGLHFIVDGARLGEPGIIATMQENPTQLERLARGFGWTIDAPGIETMYRSPVDIHVDQWVYELLEIIERTGARRVLVDSLTDLQFASGDDVRFREFMYSVSQRCARQGVSLFMTSELPHLFHVDRLSEYGVSHLSDNVVLLQYLSEDMLRIERAITVLKARASSHQRQVRRYEITSRGIRLTDPIDPASA